MSESEPKVKTIWVCPSCGWQRPEGFSSRNCGKCNATLVPKIVKEDCELNPVRYIKGYTEEYRNRNWIKCRFGKDLRDCPGYYSLEKHDFMTVPLALVEGKTAGEALELYKKGDFVIFCKTDSKPCDAKWIGEKDE